MGSTGVKLGDDGAATSASFVYPFGVVVDSTGDPPPVCFTILSPLPLTLALVISSKAQVTPLLSVTILSPPHPPHPMTLALVILSSD